MFTRNLLLTFAFTLFLASAAAVAAAADEPKSADAPKQGSPKQSSPKQDKRRKIMKMGKTAKPKPAAESAKTEPAKKEAPAYQILDFTKIDGVPCPCGLSRRGLLDEPAFPGTVHRTDIDRQAKPHYHKKLTEVYYVISCEPGAVMRLNDEHIPLHDDMAFYIPPGVVHCLIGKAKTCIFVLPKYDANDEFICE